MCRNWNSVGRGASPLSLRNVSASRLKSSSHHDFAELCARRRLRLDSRRQERGVSGAAGSQRNKASGTVPTITKQRSQDLTPEICHHQNRTAMIRERFFHHPDSLRFGPALVRHNKTRPRIGDHQEFGDAAGGCQQHPFDPVTPSRKRNNMSPPMLQPASFCTISSPTFPPGQQAGRSPVRASFMNPGRPGSGHIFLERAEYRPPSLAAPANVLFGTQLVGRCATLPRW